MMLIKLNDKGVRVYLATGGASYRRPRLDCVCNLERDAILRSRFSRSDRTLAHLPQILRIRLSATEV
jgi:hypothetical protein